MRPLRRDAGSVVLATRLIGREDECARLEQLVAGGGTITLIGPGGVGKTRLARELVLWREEYGEVVPIAHLADLAPGASDATIAAALGYESVDAAIVGLTEHTGIVVLDNCEHVVVGARRFIEMLHDAVEDLVVVATSREPLGIYGEQILPVRPLGLPSRGDPDAERAPAVELFLDRAHAAGAMFEPSSRLLPAGWAPARHRARGGPHPGDRARGPARGRRSAPQVVAPQQGLRRSARQHGGGNRSVDVAAVGTGTALVPTARRVHWTAPAHSSRSGLTRPTNRSRKSRRSSTPGSKPSGRVSSAELIADAWPAALPNSPSRPAHFGTDGCSPHIRTAGVDGAREPPDNRGLLLSATRALPANSPAARAR
jgi:hypothetical protein